MTVWAYVENKQVKGVYDRLPTSWKNISGFHHLANDLSYLESLGWYYIVKSTETFDTTKYYVSKTIYTFENDSVIESLSLKAREAVTYVNPINAIRDKRDSMLAVSDIYQLADWQKTFSEQLKLDWLLCRQQLRDLPEIYANTGELTWPSNFDSLIDNSKASMAAYLASLEQGVTEDVAN